MLDPDFGWHLQMGNLITRQGVPEVDPFSYAMPSYPFVDHEWLTHVLVAKFFPAIGMGGLSLIFTFITGLTLLVGVTNPISRQLKLETSFLSLPLLLSIGILFSYFGVRPQVLSWFFFATLFRILLDKKTWEKLRVVVPILFLGWANMHGSFAAGIVVLAIFITLRSLRERKLDLKDLIVTFASLLVTFINPYKGRIWWEAWMQFSDSSLRWRIMEWRPALFTFNIPLAIFLSLVIFFAYKYRQKFYLEEKILLIIFFVMGISTTRHIPLFVTLALPLTIGCIYYLKEETKKILYGKERFSLSLRVSLVGASILVILQGFLSLESSKNLEEGRFYPKAAIELLKDKEGAGEIFSEYGWGGYLIWKLPEKRVFIDGRMPSWRWEGRDGEEKNAFETYIKVLEGEKNYKEVFEKYSVDTVLWPKREGGGVIQKLESEFTNLLTRLKLFEENDFDFLKQLEDDGWEKVYEDDVAVVYENND